MLKKSITIMVAFYWLLQPSIAQAIFVDGFEASDLPSIAVGNNQPSSRQTAIPVGTTDSTQGYYEYLPPGYETPGQEYPLLLFIHGLGENGNGDSELFKVLNHGPLN